MKLVTSRPHDAKPTAPPLFGVIRVTRSSNSQLHPVTTPEGWNPSEPIWQGCPTPSKGLPRSQPTLVTGPEPQRHADRAVPAGYIIYNDTSARDLRMR